jgi:hypothetical protein
MAQTATSLASVIYDMWDSKRLAKQFESQNAPLGRLEAVPGAMIGTQAQVPIYNNRSGAYTSVGAAGGSLNPALNQQVTQATYTLVYSWFQTELETSALAQAGGGSQSLVNAKDLEIQGGLENTRHQMTRQAVTNSDGIVASCAAGGASTTVQLTPAASESNTLYGFSALKRNWLFPNMTVDIGTTADTDCAGDGVNDLGDLAELDGSDDHDRLVHHDGVGDALRVHPQPQLDHGGQPGAQRAPADRQHVGCAGRPEPVDRRPGVLAGGFEGHVDHGVLAGPGARVSDPGAAERRGPREARGVDWLQAASEPVLAAAEPGRVQR